MPSRTDKLDAMTLAASLTGFEFDVLEGVQGDTVSQKALSGVSLLLQTHTATTLRSTLELGAETWYRRSRGLLAWTHEFCQRVPLPSIPYLNIMLNLSLSLEWSADACRQPSLLKMMPIGI